MHLGNNPIVKRPLSTFFLTLCATVGAICAAAPASAAPASGVLTVVQAVPGNAVDVYIDNAPTPTLARLDYQRVTDPLALPAGHHVLTLRDAGSATSGPALLAGSFDVTAGTNVSLVAYANETKQPRLAIFPNDGQSAPTDRALLWFRQVAAARPVDVIVDGKPIFRSVPNIDGKATVRGIVLPAGAREVSVRAAGSATQLLVPQRVDLQPGGTTAVYLVGAQDGSPPLRLLAQTKETVAAPALVAPAVPTGVPSGFDGLADLHVSGPRAAAAVVTAGLVVLGAIMLLTGVLGPRRSRRARGA